MEFSKRFQVPLAFSPAEITQRLQEEPAGIFSAAPARLTSALAALLYLPLRCCEVPALGLSREEGKGAADLQILHLFPNVKRT